MKRLTKYICDRAHAAEGVSTEKLTGAYCRGQFEATALVERLAAIEDILGNDYDLDRLEVMVNQCMTMRDEVAERFSITAKIPIARLRELVEADRDGRCVVLPCKVGDCVWVTSAYGKQYNPPIKGHVQRFVVHDDEIVYIEAIIWMDIGCGHKGYGYTEKNFGKAVFLTPEAAEAAPKGGQDA